MTNIVHLPVERPSRRAIMGAAGTLAAAAAMAAGVQADAIPSDWRAFIENAALLGPGGRAAAERAYRAGMRLADHSITVLVDTEGRPAPALYFGDWLGQEYAVFTPDGGGLVTRLSRTA